MSGLEQRVDVNTGTAPALYCFGAGDLAIVPCSRVCSLSTCLV